MKRGQLITVSEAAAILAVHPNTVRTLIRSRMLPAAKLGGSVRIDRNGMEKWIAGQIQERLAARG